MGNQDSRLESDPIGDQNSFSPTRSREHVSNYSLRELNEEDVEQIETGNPAIIFPSKKIRKWSRSRYTNIRELGSGSQGTVYVGVRKSDRKEVVAKKMGKESLGERIGVYPKEFIIMNSLHHPNIAKVLDIEEDEDNYYMIMENYPGGDLQNFMNTYAPNGLKHFLVFRFAKQLISALRYCHDRNIAHRDIKLENIFIKNKGIEDPTTLEVVLADFGLASIRPIHDLLYDYPGSPQYASPELFRGNPHRGDKADVWALGVVLFILFTGMYPFYHEIQSELVYQVMYMVVFPEIGPENKEDKLVPPDCRPLIKWMLTKNPNLRPSLAEIEEHPCIANS